MTSAPAATASQTAPTDATSFQPSHTLPNSVTLPVATHAGSPFPLAIIEAHAHARPDVHAVPHRASELHIAHTPCPSLPPSQHMSTSSLNQPATPTTLPLRPELALISDPHLPSRATTHMPPRHAQLDRVNVLQPNSGRVRPLPRRQKRAAPDSDSPTSLATPRRQRRRLELTLGRSPGAVAEAGRDTGQIPSASRALRDARSQMPFDPGG